jgi:serine/threonine protein phosphatase PrpC
MDKGLTPQQAAQALVEEALSANSVTPATRDNVTVMVVQFAPLPSCAM